MRKLYKLGFVFLFGMLAVSASAQQNYWSSRSDNSGIITDKAVARQSFPKSYKLFGLNIDPLRQALFSIVGNQRMGNSTVITLPNVDGKFEQFEVFEASNFEPALQARFPEIRAYSGIGITDRSATLKLSISPQGIQTMVFRTDLENEFIEPYSFDHTVYAVFKSQRSKGQLPWTCSTQDQQIAAGLNTVISNPNRPASSAGELKTMRLAQSCNGEYSNFFGAFNASQVGLVLAAFNATLSRCNGCYEKDLALHLNLIPNTADVIFYDPLTDPYTTLSNWNNQLQATLTAIIGEANYDIGHMFGASGGGGNAGCIGCVCVDGQKGRGITSPADGIPMGDNFDIDYVAHEVGHQLGGNHTFSMSIEAGGTNNVEVGSGITIMGYAGITAQDVAPHSIDIFHERSIQQIQNNLATKACPITTSLAGSNATPVVAPVSNYTIPISTPFALTGSATDANLSDVLTYCWEQNDQANSSVTGNNSVAFPGKLVGPNWLSWPATTSGIRYMPRLSTILAGLNVTPCLPGGDPVANTEALSSVSRTLNFRLTVRDNAPYVPATPGPAKVGQTAFTDMIVTVDGTSGPFNVTAPNTPLTWDANSSQSVTWSVNGTNGGAVNCANVKILFSSDGGNTFPITLVASTPNDGTESITVPNITTSTARIKVESIGNIFFDISNTNFTVAPPPFGFGFTNPPPTTVSCPAAGPIDVVLGTTSTGGFSNTITLSASPAPGASTVSFVPGNTVTPGNNVTVRLSNTGGLSNGTYVITVTGTASGASTQTRDVSFVINAGAGPTINTQPVNATICATLNTSFTVAATGATSYQWQVNSGSGFGNITNGGVYTNATTATLNITGATVSMNAYQYRVIVTGQCNTTTSNAVTLTVNAPATISSQPADVSICATANTSFSVTATNAVGYQWQVNTGSGFTDVLNGGVYSNATTATLNITGATAGMNGYIYRVNITSNCPPNPVVSNNAILTVVTSVTVTTQPTSATVCAGSNTGFTTAGSGSGIIYQWQVNTGSGFVNVTNGGVYGGATSATLTITGALASMNGYQYRALLSNATCTSPGTSNTATLTVNTLPAITTDPSSSTICSGSNTAFSSAATGTGVTYQWQVNTGSGFANVTNGGVYGGATTNTLNITGATVSMSGYQYRVVASGTCAPPATSNTATLTVVAPAAITTQPVNKALCANDNTSFTVVATGTTIYQWQVNTGSGFTNISNGGVYSGATSATLNITGATAAMNTYQYRVQVSNVTCSTPLASANAVLTVHALPTVGLTATDLSLVPGHLSTITATPSAATPPNSSVATTWYFNGTAFINGGNTYVANVEQIGTYQVRIQETWTDGSVCNNQSSDVVIAAATSPKLFIFPSPNDGQFTVSYFNNGGASTNRSVIIYDSHGAKIHQQKFSITGPYTLLDIDVRPALTGIYYVVITDANGKKLAEGKVVVH